MATPTFLALECDRSHGEIWYLACEFLQCSAALLLCLLSSTVQSEFLMSKAETQKYIQYAHAQLNGVQTW
jgi:hypothetical protein